MSLAVGVMFLAHWFLRSQGINVLTPVIAKFLSYVGRAWWAVASAPMAFELFEKTRAFGNTFVFLQAGVATDFTEFGLVASNIGKRAAVALVAVTVPMILLLGFLFNNLIK